MCTVGHSSCLHFEVQACTAIHASMQRLQNQGSMKRVKPYLPECLDICDKQVLQPRSSRNPTAHMPNSYYKFEEKTRK